MFSDETPVVFTSAVYADVTPAVLVSGVIVKEVTAGIINGNQSPPFVIFPEESYGSNVSPSPSPVVSLPA